MRYFPRPLQMNLELTGKCPLRCPQCYVDPEPAREMPLHTALAGIREAAGFGVKMVNLSGGETLCYPYLTEVIRACHSYGLISAVSLSGVLATKEKLREMIEEGVNEIYISLNGSTEEVNAVTRDGYKDAVRALGYLRELGEELSFKEVYINWVMHRSNADDFRGMLSLAEACGVKGLIVLGFKPDRKGQLDSFPTRSQMRAVAGEIRTYKGPVEVGVESCFSPMRALLGEDLFRGNQNRGIFRGCGAGRDGFSLDADGHFTPCRHILLPEDFPSLEAYWYDSPVLRQLRGSEDHREVPCAGCRFEDYCLPCPDIAEKLTGSLMGGFPGCPLAET